MNVMIWLQFIISSALIVLSATRLTTYADILGDRLHVGKVWIGVILLGLVTSLPEAVTSLTAVVSLKANDLAIGNMVGSNNFNPTLIVIMDFMYRQGSVTNKVRFNRSHGLSACFAILLTALVMGEILLSRRLVFPTVGPVSLGSFLIFIVYFWGVKSLAQLGKKENCVDTAYQRGETPDQSLGKIYVNLFVCAVFVVGGAIWLTNVTDTIAVVTGLGRTFVGTFFLALVTSLPEMVVTVSALRLGVLDLAIGNIFGSNMINMFLVSVCDVFYLKGPLLASVSRTHIVTAFLSILLMGIALLGIKQKSKRAVGGLGWDSILLMVFFIAGMGLVYRLR